MQIPPSPPPGFGGAVLALPPGWTQHQAPTGHPYWYHAASKTSTYAHPGAAAPPPPPGFAGVAAEASTSAQPQLAKAKTKKKKEKPVEKLPIEGTPWLRITTNEGNTFYTNTETKTSVWTVPDEIKEQVAQLLANGHQNGAASNGKDDEAARLLLEQKEAEMQKLREELEQEREASRKRKLEEEQAQDNVSNGRAQKMAKPTVTVEDDDAEQAEQDGQTEQPEQLDEEGEPEPEQLEDWQLDELRLKQEMEAELQTPAPASEQATDFSSEESIALFRTMLAEKDINPMKPWDMELPKFISDPRYKAVKSLRERRDLFDEHCKHKVRENRLKKASAGQKKADPAAAYRALLVAEVKSTRTHWEDFRTKHKKDQRFREFGRDDRERERVFRNWLRELGEMKRADAEKAEAKFTEMLAEHADSIASEAKWSGVKSRFASDPRYSLIASSTQREEAFKKFQERRKAEAGNNADAQTGEDPEEAKKRAAEDRKKRQEASLREREEKVRKEREALDRAAGRSRAEAGREESEREYRSLLIDAVRDHEAKWNDVLPSLEKDPRFTSSTLTMGNKRRLFDEHLDSIYNKRISVLEGLFLQHAPKLRTSFEDVYARISADPNVTRLHMSESSLARLYDDWSRRRFAQAKKDFEAMLAESSFVEYWGKLKQEARNDNDQQRTKELLGNSEGGGDDDDGVHNVEEAVDLRAMAAQIDYKELHAVLRHDKRYSVFDDDPDMRDSLLREHVESLTRPKQTVYQR